MKEKNINTSHAGTRKFNPNQSMYHAILFKAHGEKAIVLAKGENWDKVFSSLKVTGKLTKSKAVKAKPNKPKAKYRLWEDLESVKDLIAEV